MKNDDLKQVDITMTKPSIEEPPELELKDLPSHLEYAFLEGTDKLPVIISKELKYEEKTALLKVLKSHKRAMAWKISNIKGIDPRFCTHKILMEDDFKPAVQHQRRVNPKIHKVIKKEVIKLLDARLIYPISDSLWVSPIHCVPKKGGMTVVENEDNELIPSRYFQIPIDPQDQEKTTFTCPYGTFSYRRMPFGLCNASGTFQRCMMAIFYDMIEETMKVFMDDLSVFEDSFSSCLSHLDKMLNGAVLGQRKTKHFQPIHYASKTMTDAQAHYTTTEKELLAVVYAFEKLRLYLVLSKTVVYTDHSALKYLLAKQDAKPRLLRLENPHQGDLEKKEITETFPFETLKMISFHGNSSTSWFADIANYHAGNFVVKGMSSQQKKTFFKDVEAKALPTNDARVVVKFLKSLFARFGTPRAIISDGGTYFCNDQFAKVMLKYRVTHRLSIVYHPQTSGQVEVSNRVLKRILERTVGKNQASWSDKLDDALWAFRTAFKTPIGCIPYKLVYENACHLPIELEHKAYWALKHCNFNLKTAGDHRKVQMNELNELRDQAYKNSLIYKEKTKKIHDSKIKNRVFNVGDRVLLFNSRLKIFSGKLKTRWTGPFTVAQVFPFGTVELSQTDGPNFKDCPDFEDSRAREIPSGESKVHIEVLSVLWGNKLPIPDSSLPLSRVLIEAPWFRTAASVEARISLIMLEFYSCLFADSPINLLRVPSIDCLHSWYEGFALFLW
ncbi:reverse transcriptase domain-containing protein [Tanacetum coccineum]